MGREAREDFGSNAQLPKSCMNSAPRCLVSWGLVLLLPGLLLMQLCPLNLDEAVSMDSLGGRESPDIRDGLAPQSPQAGKGVFLLIKSDQPNWKFSKGHKNSDIKTYHHHKSPMNTGNMSLRPSGFWPVYFTSCLTGS